MSATDTKSATYLPQKQAGQLARLPDAESRKAAYEECASLHSSDQGKAYRSPRFITDLTHIINRRLKAIAPPVPAEPEAPEQTAPAPKPTPTKPAPVATPSVQTFKHSPDEQPESADEMDWRSFEEDLQTVLTWVENQKIDAEPAYRKQAVSTLCAVADWITRSR